MNCGRASIISIIRLSVLVAACLGIADTANAVVTMTTVPVGAANNAADTTGSGKLSYAFHIGKYEVTAGQYTDFLNAVADTDTYSLYDTNMANMSTGASAGSGITRTGASGSYSYTVDPGFVNKPVTHVSFGDSARFVNWLQNGQPVNVLQTATSTENGAYTLLGATSAAALTTVTRNPGAVWALPNYDEWYKAAFYDTAITNYWDYPNKSNTAMTAAAPVGTSANGNFNTALNTTSVVGSYTNAIGPWGTFDQGGNLWEWTEQVKSGTTRAIVGSGFNNVSNPWASAQAVSGLNPYTSDAVNFVLGFRVVFGVPEPSSIVLGIFGAAGLAAAAVRARRRKQILSASVGNTTPAERA